MHRIISLIASSTEIVHSLGFGDQMVGRSHECDYPPTVKELPACTSPKFSTDGTSYEIDQRVKAIVQESLSVYRVDAEKIESLKPTHIITQTQCEVCAVSLKDVEAAACQLISSKPAIISLEPNELEDIWNDIQKVGIALGAEAKAATLLQRLKGKMNAIAGRAQGSPKVKVAVIEWIDPLMAAGCWLPQLVEMAGAELVLSQPARPVTRLSWHDLVVSDPDIIIVSPCGFDMARTQAEMKILSERADYSKLKAVKHQRVFLVDGNQYMNRPGPRIVESLEILAEIIHPKLFKFEHEGTAWVRYLS
jgi:iron complex transport system substrate-binding protein